MSLYTKYSNLVKDFFIKEKLLLVLLSITCLLSYGFTITHFSIGIDDTSFARYYREGGLLSQQRFSGVFLDKIFGFQEFAPFWYDLVAVLLLFCAAIIWCILFKSISNNKLSSGSLIVFSTLFVSYPLINEIFIYMTASISICLGYALSGIALTLAYEYILNKKHIVLGVASAAIMCFTVALYESFAVVYLCGIFAILILHFLFSNNNESAKGQFSKYLLYIAKFLAILMTGVILSSIVSNLLLYFLKITNMRMSSKHIYWLEAGTLTDKISLLFTNIYHSFIISEVLYIPIIIFSLTFSISLIYAIILSAQRKSFLLFFMMIGLAVSNISLSIIQGIVTPNRACQSFAIFIGFTWMLIFLLLPKVKWQRFLVGCLVFFIVFTQTRDLSQWFYNDYKRYEQDKMVAYQVSFTIKGKIGDSVKAVVFIGYANEYPNIKFNQTNGQSVVRWGGYAFGEHSTELYKFLEMNGQYFTRPTEAQFDKANSRASSMPVWPSDGSVKEFDDFVVVRFS